MSKDGETSMVEEEKKKVTRHNSALIKTIQKGKRQQKMFRGSQQCCHNTISQPHTSFHLWIPVSVTVVGHTVNVPVIRGSCSNPLH